jgi:hypothetical protein
MYNLSLLLLRRIMLYPPAIFSGTYTIVLVYAYWFMIWSLKKTAIRIYVCILTDE